MSDLNKVYLVTHSDDQLSGYLIIVDHPISLDFGWLHRNQVRILPNRQTGQLCWVPTAKALAGGLGVYKHHSQLNNVKMK